MTTRRRITDPVEQMAQRVAERVVDLVLQVLDINALLAQRDLNALLERIDVAALLARVDLNAVLARVDTDALLDRMHRPTPHPPWRVTPRPRRSGNS
jgi:hypothetical protein